MNTKLAFSGIAQTPVFHLRYGATGAQWDLKFMASVVPQGQPTGQGMTMIVTGAHISTMGSIDRCALLEVDVLMDNANAGAGRPDYTAFVLSDPSGRQYVNVDTLPMVPAYSDLTSQLAFQVTSPTPAGHYTLAYTPTFASWPVDVS